MLTYDDPIEEQDASPGFGQGLRGLLYAAAGLFLAAAGFTRLGLAGLLLTAAGLAQLGLGFAAFLIFVHVLSVAWLTVLSVAWLIVLSAVWLIVTVTMTKRLLASS